ncbi:hypothetical protein BGY98DRAFT_225091 [Russula aff. rugulosa BPL654]|nr:hypothetical protein BGY98DRAFT_225091 [Russula aff. rugulosa BPL654]
MSDNPNPTEDNTQDNDHQATMPLGVELTGYRLLTTGVILGVGVPKAVYSYNGQALISTTLDWLAGVIFALILFWLGEAKRPGLFPLFFHVDYAPSILRFLCRPEVYICFLSTFPLLINTMHLRAVLDARRNHEYGSDIPAYAIKNSLAVSVEVLTTAICICCLQLAGVIWPRVFRVTARRRLLFIINFGMWLFLTVVLVDILWRDKRYLASTRNVTEHNLIWLYPITLLPFCKHLRDTRDGERRNEMLLCIMMNE